MSISEFGDDRKRLDPYDPRTGATGNDDPNEVDDEADDDETEGNEDAEGDDEELGS